MKATANTGVNRPVTAALAIALHRFVSVRNKMEAGYPIIGVSTDSNDANQPVPIQTFGIAVVEAGEAIAVGDYVISGADGKAMKYVAPTVGADALAIADISGNASVADLEADINTMTGQLETDIDAIVDTVEEEIQAVVPASLTICGFAIQAASADGDLISIKLL